MISAQFVVTITSNRSWKLTKSTTFSWLDIKNLQKNDQQLFGDSQIWFKIVDHDQIDGLFNATKRLFDSFRKCEQWTQRLRHVDLQYPDEFLEYSITFEYSKFWNKLQQSFPTQLTTSLKSLLRLTVRFLLSINLLKVLMHKTISHSINSLAATMLWLAPAVMAQQASRHLFLPAPVLSLMFRTTLRCDVSHSFVRREQCGCESWPHLRALLAMRGLLRRWSLCFGQSVTAPLVLDARCESVLTQLVTNKKFLLLTNLVLNIYFLNVGYFI